MSDRGRADSSAFGTYMLALLMAIFASNAIDRVALGVLLQDIKIDLNLSDTQLGLMTGIAFSLFYSVMGIPIARWADRGDRTLIISLTTGLWSIAVALCGMATSFVQLLLLRIGAAVGEAGCVPSANSLIADYFDRDERPRAVSRYMLGVPIALALGYFGAGWLNQLYGWHMTFVILGLPGLVLALLARLTLKEPRRTATPQPGLVSPTAKVEHRERRSLLQVCAALWNIPSFRHLLISFSVWNFFGSGVQQWMMAFFIRSHGLQTGELGTWFAVVYGIGVAVGVYIGGEWATRYAAGNERLQLRMCALTFAPVALIKVYSLLTPSYHLAFAALALSAATSYLSQGPILATMQTLVAPRMRAISIALVYLCSNLIGLGFGPLAAGALSDALRPWLSDESLRYALLILCPGNLWAAWHLWHASRTVASDVGTAQSNPDDVAAPGRLAVADSRG